MPDSGQNTKGNTGNLRPPWKPGESGNPGGRPKRKPLTDAYAAILAQPVPAEVARKLNVDSSTTYAEIIAMALVREAVKGNVQAASQLADRVEGRAMERMQLDVRGDPLGDLLAEFRKDYEDTAKAGASQ